MVVRVSVGLQGSLLLLTIVGSAALTFVVGKPRLLWSLPLAAVCGFSVGRLGAVWQPDLSTAVSLLIVVAPLVVLGAGFAWRPSRWHPTAAGWLGAVYPPAMMVGSLSTCWLSDCGEPTIAAVIVFIPIGAVLAGVSALLTVALKTLIHRSRSRSRSRE
jgi:hypothetical protein